MTDSKASLKLMSLGLLALAGLFSMCGCAVAPDEFAYARLSAPYYQTRLGAGSSLDVLAQANAPDYQFDPEHIGKQLLSQSDTMVALSGQTADGFKTWVNLVAFDASRMTARRKYFFCSDERATNTTTEPLESLVGRGRGLYFDAQLLLDAEIRTTPYATDEARQIAILRWLADQFNADVRSLTDSADEPTNANELVATAGMMMNQTFQGVLLTLGKSPGLARNLAGAQGVAFGHISLDEGRIQMLATDDAVALKIRVNLPLTP
ncbi:MAG: hypothetical protein JSW27_07625 [Phycisphaerales bacterium]|nr:MAG: hypothetical protein JSW27_07625 [Phycisphaerales bacterium]